MQGPNDAFKPLYIMPESPNLNAEGDAPSFEKSSSQMAR
jgi:hypothetical protein